MTWLYIIAILLVQVIVAVLLISYIDRGSKRDVSSNPSAENSEILPSSTDAEQKTEISEKEPELSPSIGESTFVYGQFRDMIKEVMLPIVKECIAEAMDARECEFVNDKNADIRPEARMTNEQEKEAWTDNRDIEERLQNEDNTPAMPNPLAGGASFDEIAQATVLVETPGDPTPSQHRFIVKVFHQLEGTQFEDLMPDSMREKVYACHRNVESNSGSFKDKIAEMDAEASKVKAIPDPVPITKQDPATKSDEEAKPQRSYVPLKSFANPNKRN